MSTKIKQLIALAMITATVILVTVIINQDKINCSAPATWATESGVRHCAVNGGE